MRGVVFTELIEFVEDVLGFETADKMIADAKLNNDGAFTQGGNYPFSELSKLLISLTKITGKSKDDLLFIFGEHLFSVLVRLYGRSIKEIGSSLDFIATVDQYVHVEVRKLYPDADLPVFETLEKNDNLLILNYKSEKKMEAFAHGLIKSCGKYFKESLDISYEKTLDAPYTVKFTIRKM